MRWKIKLSDLESALWKSWSRETSADPTCWGAYNNAWGQCAVTSLVVQDFFGGSIWCLDISKHPNPLISAMRSHYFNSVNFYRTIDTYVEVDLSESQFGPGRHYEVRRYAEPPQEKSREYLLNNKSTKERYASLRIKVSRILSGFEDNLLFEEPIFINCLLLALNSNCQKGQYGCVVRHRGWDFIATTNGISELLKDWSESVCIRIRNDILSRTKSMIGCCDHAEERALDIIRQKGWDPKKCELYVAGFRSNGLIYIKPEPVFTCLRCANQLYRSKIGAIYVPCKERWAKMTTEEAVETAKQFAMQEKVLENYQST